MDVVCLEREGRKPEDMRDVFAVPLTLAAGARGIGLLHDHPTEIRGFVRGRGSRRGRG